LISRIGLPNRLRQYSFNSALLVGCAMYTHKNSPLLYLAEDFVY